MTPFSPRDWFAISLLLQRVARRRLSYRLLGSGAVSLAVTQTLLCVVADYAIDVTPLGSHFIVETLLWVLWFGLVCGWQLSGGFLDTTTSQFLAHQLRDRAISPTSQTALERLAQTTWLLFVMSWPIVVVGAAVLARVRNPEALLELCQLLGRCLLVAALAAVTISVAAVQTRKVSSYYPKRVAAAALIGPELLRLIDPTLPTLRTVASTIKTWVLYSGGWS